MSNLALRLETFRAVNDTCDIVVDIWYNKPNKQIQLGKWLIIDLLVFSSLRAYKHFLKKKSVLWQYPQVESNLQIVLSEVHALCSW